MTDTELERSPVWDMLSDYGRRVRFLTDGVLGQTWQAREQAYAFNATLGEFKEQGKDVCLASLHKSLGAFAPEDVYPYAKPGGVPELRKLWKAKMLEENPTLRGKQTSLPLVCAGLTHGLCLVGEMFLDPGDPVILHDMHWENYELIFETKSRGRMVSYPTFRDGGFNIAGLKQSILSERAEKQLVILNFPNNPSGYMPTRQEALALRQALLECAQAGKKLTVLCDDAYYGFWYGEDILRESLFGYLTGIHPNVLTIRLDGATKEFFAGGLRIGFLTFGGQPEQVLAQLEKKLMGAVRIGVSSCSHLSQTILMTCLESKEIRQELAQKKARLCGRGKLAMELCRKGSPAGAWTAYPFGAGYFICLETAVDARALRQHLLEDYGIGVIALDSRRIRIALPCLEEPELRTLFSLLDRAIAETGGKK